MASVSQSEFLHIKQRQPDTWLPGAWNHYFCRTMWGRTTLRDYPAPTKISFLCKEPRMWMLVCPHPDRWKKTQHTSSMKAPVTYLVWSSKKQSQHQGVRGGRGTGWIHWGWWNFHFTQDLEENMQRTHFNSPAQAVCCLSSLPLWPSCLLHVMPQLQQAALLRPRGSAHTGTHLAARGPNLAAAPLN